MEGTKALYKVSSREEAIEKYREWIVQQPDLMNSLHELKGKVLCCYCKPKACHGDVLAELADQSQRNLIFNGFLKGEIGMFKYRVHTDIDCSIEFESLEEAEKTYERWKDGLMADGVTAGDTYVEIVKSNDDFEDYVVIKKVVAVVDNERTELGTPREEGFEWDYWAKWEEVDLSIEDK